jgi:hypothetical protein
MGLFTRQGVQNWKKCQNKCVDRRKRLVTLVETAAPAKAGESVPSTLNVYDAGALSLVANVMVYTRVAPVKLAHWNCKR